MLLIYIFIGGGVGACMRWGVQRWAAAALPQFPFGVLACNLIGSFLIGVLFGAWQKPNSLQIALMTGLLGGFTTFSSFSLDTLKLFQSGNPLLAMTNICTSVILGLAFVWLGLLTSQMFSSH